MDWRNIVFKIHCVVTWILIVYLVWSIMTIEPNLYVYNETYTIDGYKFYFATSCGTISKPCLGYTHNNNDIYILDRQGCREMYKTCKHEICHNLVADKKKNFHPEFENHCYKRLFHI